MIPSVYIETTIPSFYYETREDAESVAMRNWTRQWWDAERVRFDCFTSAAVIEELESGNYPRKTEKMQLVEALPWLEVTTEIEEIVQVYLANHLMPNDSLGDALHLAIASFHKADYLLTWNCKHLANASKRQHVRRINERLRLSTPEILTPMELTET
jgi:predicted nucleic acid-binding protein